MKVSIVGGGGLVGSTAAFALQCGAAVREIALLDIDQNRAAGQAFDLLHGGPSTADQIITAGGYEHIPDSDVICITAGLRRKPDESRLDLIHRNTDLFLSIVAEVNQAGVKDDAVVLVVSNPVDILTYLAADRFQLPTAQVIGLGTQLDTIRFRSLIAQQLKAAPSQIAALILGEHGDSMVPIWSSASVAGLPLDKHPLWSANLAHELFVRTKGAGAEILRTKGGAGFAVAVAIRDVIESILLDRRRILPVSTVQDGCYGVRDVALSVPTAVGRGGALERYEIALWPKEVQGLRNSALVLRQTLKSVLNRVGSVRK